MHCNEIQTKIAMQDLLTPDERRHADGCPDCASFSAFDFRLDSQLADWRVPRWAPRRRALRKRSFRWSYAGVAIAAAIGLGILALPTPSSAERAYREMTQEARHVGTVHLVVRWTPDDGNPNAPLRRIYEMWWTRRARREETQNERPTIKRLEPAGLAFYRYDPEAGKVSVSREMTPQPDFGTFDLESFARQYMDMPRHFEQPTPTEIVVTNAGGWSRMVFTLDPPTWLPTHAVKQFRSGMHWHTVGEIDMQFDRPIPSGRFDPSGLNEEPEP